ncbi:hypothetical protein HPB49_013233 [Dermacentor silvarum]|uniref:Uncharacterized protein n=1 Tax=Dermacentor silvarum TaxID=543639 RepID=A0ACB8CL34_DERSI|nr:hypothetical protein HPB49_013233 [Dermacentor silvarum]
MERNVPEVSTGPIPITDSTESPTPVMNHYAVRLPPFGPDHPDISFIRVEARFLVSNATSQQARYSYLLGALPNDIATEVCNILTSPPNQTPYDTLKKAILERAAISERKRLQVLLSSTELGDHRPSELPSQMQALIGTRVSCFNGSLLKELFKQRLPHAVQIALPSTSELNLTALAVLADKVCELEPSQLSVAAASSEVHTSSRFAAALPTNQFPTPEPTSPEQDDIAEIHADIPRLRDLVASKLTTRDDDTSARHFGDRRFG